VYQSWLKKHGLEDAVAMQHASASGLLSAVRTGFGLAALPCFIADLEPDLIRCMSPMTSYQRGLWLLTAERLRHTPRVRCVLDFLAERLVRLSREGVSRATAAQGLGGPEREGA
jgi:DNA-binding transcriptional LysR family regulator